MRVIAIALLVAVASAATATAAPISPQRTASVRWRTGDGPVPLVSDGAAVVATLPVGWSSSVGPGFQGAHRIAWILMGDFRLPASAARHEGTPNVPSGKVLVAIGDFFPAGASIRWPSVKRLHIPRTVIASSRWWRVRWAGRALAIQVTFGSAPTSPLIRQVEQILSDIHRGHFH